MKKLMHNARMLSTRLESRLPVLPIMFQFSVSVACLVAAFVIRDDVLASEVVKVLSIICSANLLRSLTTH
ncbi:hypothetical protein [Larkinella punicea]|uniref:Uncharacterized protein n=1 Tax=Larkinella punicea TaxID=2315727 RepID=A0A368JUW9_9BACT|nr:hypothetical protein [Larkinella punicea]RCR71448.1 hypothetical protein DUE52_00475 [Larkinella punicea]